MPPVTIGKNAQLPACNKILETFLDISKIIIQGATFEALSSNEKARLNVDYGFKITSLTNGKLKNAGISAGFILLSVDRKPLRTTQDLKETLTSRQGGVLIEGLYPNGLRADYGIGL